MDSSPGGRRLGPPQSAPDRTGFEKTRKKSGIMKRLISSLLALAVLLSLTACSLNFSFEFKGNQVIEPDSDGVAAGYAGDTLRTAFFDMTVENPQFCTEFDGLIPDEGYKFLTADLTLYNYTADDQPMYDDDFNVLWTVGEGEDMDFDGDYPLYEEVRDKNGNSSYTTKSDKQMPVEFTLTVRETRTELLLFQVPEEIQEFYIAFQELVDDGTEEGQWGDVFYVQVAP